jgi:CDP-diacylglycerol---serine O-phosphatidyltransferase
MRRVNILPNIITAFALACGLFVIFKVNMVEPGGDTYQLLHTSVLLLLLAAFADLVDGATARLFHAESEFGFMFDSLADAVSFGVAPSVLLLKSLPLELGTGLSFYAVAGAMLYSIAGILRLVRFNVQAGDGKKSPAEKEAQKKHFTGMPIPAAALAAVSANLFLASPQGKLFFPMTESTHIIVLTSLMIVLGYFMVSRLKFPSFKVLHFRIRSFWLVFFTVLAALFFLYGVLFFFPLLVAMLCWGYFTIALILAIIRKVAGKRSKTLEEFEPDDED